jgi:uncharacterized protein (DUF2062 family)
MLKQRFVAFLKRGVTPHELALCLALGCVISVIPLLGVTMLLCALAAWALRLNQPAIQSVNWIMYPFQFILLIPWYKLGAILFRAPPVTFTGQYVRDLIHTGWGTAIKTLWTFAWHGVIAWAIVSLFVAAAIYAILRPIFARMADSMRAKPI